MPESVSPFFTVCTVRLTALSLLPLIFAGRPIRRVGTYAVEWLGSLLSMICGLGDFMLAGMVSSMPRFKGRLRVM